MAGPGNPMLFLPPRPPVALGPKGSLVIGRSRTCDVTLASPDASRRHAEIVTLPSGYLVRDLGSTNGTWVNGDRISGRRRLRNGDRLVVGETCLRFHTPTDDASLSTAAVRSTHMMRRASRPSTSTGCRCWRGTTLPPISPSAIAPTSRRFSLWPSSRRSR